MNDCMAKDINRAIKLGYDIKIIGAETINVREFDADGNIARAFGLTKPTDGGAGFAKGCQFVDTDVATGTSGLYENIGTTSSCNFNIVNALAGGDIALAALVGSEARTATAAGLTTGAITAPTTFRTIVTVTSAAATDQIALPAISSSTIGQEIFLSVGANGYELITPASSNNTINLVDADGTNQLDVAANTTVRCTQVSATSWLAETIAATTIAVTAPDND